MVTQPTMCDGLTVLHEDSDLLVVSKPAGLVCHPTKLDGRSSLVSRVRSYLGTTATPRLVNRLDRETSGVMLVAKTPEAARKLGRLFETRAVTKEYLAVVHDHVKAEAGVVDAPLGKDERSVVAIKDCVRSDGAPAQTEWQVLRRFNRAEGCFSLLRLVPRSGRKHQLRIHLAHIGHPIVGDKLYGGDEMHYLNFVHGRLTGEQRERLLLPFQALHANELRFVWCGRHFRFQAEPECWFSEFVRP